MRLKSGWSWRRRGVVLWAALAVAAAPPTSRAAPRFSVVLHDGRRIASTDLKGKLVVLNFWATWCAPCRAELAELDAFQRRHPDAVAIFAVEAERRPEPRLLARQAAAMAIPIAMLAEGGDSYHPINSAVPSTYVIDGSGRLVLARAGALAPGELDAIAGPLLNSAARSER